MTDNEDMKKALEQAKEQFGPLIELADYLLDAMSNSKIPNSIANFIGRLRNELINNGFSREEAMSILTAPSMDIVGMLKQDNKK